MPVKKQLVVVQGWTYVPAEEGAHPEHPIYIPVEPPPDSGLSPEHPIYFPVYPDQGLPGDQPRPEHPIYLPVYPDIGLPGDQPHPEHPIYIPVYPDHELPPVPPISELPPEALEKLKLFLFGNLPPSSGGPEYPSPVGKR